MTAAELLAEAESTGLHLAAEGERLAVRGPKSAESLVQTILDRKAEILALLRAKLPPPATPEPTAPTPSPVPAAPWDQAEADRLLDQLHHETARLKATWRGGTFPPVVDNVVQIATEVCEAYVRDHEQEAARGWDPLALLRNAVPWALGLATPKRGPHP